MENSLTLIDIAGVKCIILSNICDGNSTFFIAILKNPKQTTLKNQKNRKRQPTKHQKLQQIRKPQQAKKPIRLQKPPG